MSDIARKYHVSVVSRIVSSVETDRSGERGRAAWIKAVPSNWRPQCAGGRGELERGVLESPRHSMPAYVGWCPPRGPPC